MSRERDRGLVLDAASVGALLYLAFLGSAVTFVLYYWMLGRVAATRASLIAYVVPIVAVGVGIFCLGEPITFRILAGAALVVAGVAMAAHSPRPQSAPPEITP